MDVLTQICQPVATDMDRYKHVFDSYLVHDNALLHRVLRLVSERSGKRMRPLLTLLAAKLVAGEINEKTIYTAAAFEYLHTASLIHDDIVDESEERRGQDSVNHTFGNQVAVLVGDFLLAISLQCTARTGQPRLLEIVSEASQRLADGELLQLNTVMDETVSEEVYFNVIHRKTAALFAACAEAGALSVTDDETMHRRMREFGEFVGTCFQIRDDIFDYNNDKDIGKPTGHDLQEGKLTLPVIHALLTASDEGMWALSRKVKERKASNDEIAVLVDFAKQNGGIDYAVETMHAYADKAKSLLDSFPDSDVKQTLLAYADYVVGRSF